MKISYAARVLPALFAAPAAAQTVALLQRNPELLARAFSSLSPEARADAEESLAMLRRALGDWP